MVRRSKIRDLREVNTFITGHAYEGANRIPGDGTDIASTLEPMIIRADLLPGRHIQFLNV